MKRDRSTLLSGLALIIVFAYIILSVFFPSDIIETVKTVTLSAPLIFYLYNIRSDDGRKKALALLLSAVVFFAVNLIAALITDDAPLGASITMAVSSLFLLLPLTVITFRRKTAVPVTAAQVLITLPALQNTVAAYAYLYRNISDYPTYLTYSTFLALALILTVLSELIFNTKINYLSDGLLLSAVSLSYFSAVAEGVENPVLSPDVLVIMLILLIYIAREEKVRYTPEVRKIVFSTLKPREIEPLRRKKKARVYEIPPNVPVNDVKNDDE